jgi:membrane protease YdiL (CAAX protease family)
MSNAQRVHLIVCLTLAMIATTHVGGLFESWLKHVLRGSPYSLLAADGIAGAAMIVVWLLPLLVAPNLRDIGSLRLPVTWTLLLVLPDLLLNVYFFSRTDYTWLTRVMCVWTGMQVGIFEELVFRGYAFRQATRSRPRSLILISATCFGLMHLINLTHQPARQVLLAVPLAFAIGLGLGIVRIVSGSIAWCMLLHGALDSARGWFYFDATYDKLHLPAVATTFIASILVLYLHPRIRHLSFTYDATTQTGQPCAAAIPIEADP